MDYNKYFSPKDTNRRYNIILGTIKHWDSSKGDKAIRVRKA